MLPNPEDESELKQAAEALLERYRITFGKDGDRLWRYLSIEKFVSLLVSGTACFRRLDSLTAKFEGTLSSTGLEAQSAELECAAKEHKLLPEGVVAYEIAYLTSGSMDALIRASIYANCWTLDPYESWAMWSNFGKNGVAVGSTMGEVRDAFQGAASLDEPGRAFCRRS